jgi:hypothetical protein
MMRRRKMKIRNGFAIAAVALTAAVGGSIVAINGGQAQMSKSNGSDGFKLAVSGNGSIHLPNVDYRKDWVMLGSYAVAADSGTQGSQGLHVVYTQPESVAAYRRTGKFPDGAVLIKELFTTTTEAMTTGTVSRADKTAGWFVMIKDSTNRYPGNKLWGDGWGWAYFDANDRVRTKSTDYEANCKGCHVPVQNSDWVYVQGYPVLKCK